MPIARTEPKNMWTLDHFKKTPIMPTYLLAFVVCDFEGKTAKSKRGTNVSYVTGSPSSLYESHKEHNMASSYKGLYGIFYKISMKVVKSENIQ